MTFSQIAIDPTNSNVVYAATTYLGAGGFARFFRPSFEPYGVFKSTDGGVSWARVLAGIATDVVIDPTNPSVIYAAIGNNGGDEFSFGVDNGIYKSTDGGANWVKLSGGLPTANVGRIELAIAPSAPSTLYAAIQDSARDTFGSLLGIFKTTDGGSTWTQLTKPSDRNYADPCTLAERRTGQCWYDLVLAVRPTDPNEIWIGGVGLFKSNDGGLSWVEMQLARGSRVVSFAFAPSDTSCNTYFAGTNRGKIFRTTDGGVNWTDISASLTNRFVTDIAVHPSDPNIAYAVFSGFLTGHVFKTMNALSPSPTWTNISGSLPDIPFNAIELDPSDPNIVYAGADIGVYRSTDGGASWSLFGEGLPNVAVFDLMIHPVTGTLIAVTHGRGMFGIETR